jgi:hypothetical protein
MSDLDLLISLLLDDARSGDIHISQNAERLLIICYAIKALIPPSPIPAT